MIGLEGLAEEVGPKKDIPEVRNHEMCRSEADMILGNEGSDKKKGSIDPAEPRKELSEEDDVDSKQPVLAEPSTPKKKIIDSVTHNFGSVNSLQLTPCRKAAIDAKSVSKYRFEIESALNSSGEYQPPNRSHILSNIKKASLQNGRSNHRRGYATPAAPVRNLGQSAGLTNRPSKDLNSSPNGKASQIIRKLPESPLLSEPRTPKSVRRRDRALSRVGKTPNSDPKSATDMFYSSVYDYYGRSETSRSSPLLMQDFCTSNPNSTASSPPDLRIYGRKYYYKTSRNDGSDKVQQVNSSLKIDSDSRAVMNDINSIPKTLIPEPFSKDVLSARLSKLIVFPPFPQLVEVNDAPPPFCYEGFLAKKSISRKRSAPPDGMIQSKKLRTGTKDKAKRPLVRRLKRLLGFAC